MLIDVVLIPAQAQNKSLKGRIAIVLDILRATSTIVTALGHQANQVMPVPEPETALRLKQASRNCILGGERRGYKISGFDLGNSPAEYSEVKVAGKDLILCTSNGTKAVLWAKEAREILIGSFLNMDAIGNYLKLRPGDVTIVCSGSEGDFSLEDLTGAGMIIDLAGANYELTDTAKVAQYTFQKANQYGLTSFVSQAEHGRYLREIGMESDIALCTALNKFPVVPRLVDGVIKAR